MPETGSLLEGTYRERSGDAHVVLRAALIDSGRELPPPTVDLHARGDAFAPDALLAQLAARLAARGLGVVQLDEPLPDKGFLALGEQLGAAMPETDPAVAPFVDHGVVLNLVTVHAPTADVSLQPFAANSLSLHSEGSGRPFARQPRYIALMCVEPGLASGAQTVLVPMSRVANQLTADQLAVLRRVRYRRGLPGERLLRTVAGRPVFSFRDFTDQALEWTYEGTGGDPDSISGAIGALLAAMYAPTGALGVRWSPGLLVIIDNTYFFHGRSRGQVDTSTSRRHLKRLRIVG